MDSPTVSDTAENRTVVTAPRVEVVLIAHDPGPWFDEVLSSLAVQDYPRVHCTIIASSGEFDIRNRAEQFLDDVEVRAAGDATGFAAAANQVLDDESRPAFYLFCHDDVALTPDTVRLLVEESLRSNASVVGPKLVDWEVPDELLEVGLDVDKLGHVAGRVEEGELDQEQHDAVADVFAVSAAVMLVRADLFEAVGGFDSSMGVIGEDIDLCWRAHVAGARVLVVPSAVARHRVAMGERRSAVAVERVRERHRLRSVLSNYGLWHTARVLPQALILSFLRIIAAVAGGRIGRAGAIIDAWRWNLARPASLLRRRRSLRQMRQLGDHEIRRLQVGGFVPISAFFRGQLDPDHADGSPVARLRRLVDAVRAGPSRVSVGFWVIATFILFAGSRDLVSGGIPAVGDLMPFDRGAGEMLSQWSNSWVPTGTGREGTAPTAWGILGSLGVIVFGSMGLVRAVLTLGMLPIGLFGMWRLLRPFDSSWIRVVGCSMYLVTPVPYNALSNGVWGGLLLYGLLPWVVAGLARGGRLSPFGPVGGRVGPGMFQPSWPREMLGLGLLAGFLAAFTPLSLAIIAVVAVLMTVGSVVAGWPGGAGRLLGVASGGLCVAVVLNLAWFVDIAQSSPDLTFLFGTRPLDAPPVELTAALRLESGRYGAAPLGWALPLAAVVPLLLARGDRFAWAVRGWLLYLAGAASYWASSQGWVDVVAPRPELLLVPAALGLAMASAMGVAAIERDLATYRFGWRQLMPLTAVAALLVAVLPLIAVTVDGSWRMPDEQHSGRLGVAEPTDPARRVLWIGHDDVLGPAGQRLENGLTLAVSSDATWSINDRWAGLDEPGTDLAVEAVELAIDRGTSRLGRLLGPLGIDRIVLIERLAPLPASGLVEPIPDRLFTVLSEQLDLQRVQVAGTTVFLNTNALTVGAAVPEGTTGGRSLRDFVADLSQPVIGSAFVATDPDRLEGQVTADEEVYLAVPGDSRWRLRVDGEVASRGPALDWAVSFLPGRGGDAVLEHRTTDGHRFVMIAQAIVWVMALLAALRLSVTARAAIAPVRPGRERRR